MTIKMLSFSKLSRFVSAAAVMALAVSVFVVATPSNVLAATPGYFWSSKKTCSFGFFKNATVSVRFNQDAAGNRRLSGYSFYGDLQVKGVNMQQYKNGTFIKSVSTDPGNVTTATRTNLEGFFSWATPGGRQAKLALTPTSGFPYGSCNVTIDY